MHASSCHFFPASIICGKKLWIIKLVPAPLFMLWVVNMTHISRIYNYPNTSTIYWLFGINYTLLNSIFLISLFLSFLCDRLPSVREKQAQRRKIEIIYEMWNCSFSSFIFYQERYRYAVLSTLSYLKGYAQKFAPWPTKKQNCMSKIDLQNIYSRSVYKTGPFENILPDF